MPSDRHVNFFALEKACEKDGCPVCTIVRERIARYIDGMLFEHISDRSFRAQYRSAGGFCSVHSEVLLSYRDGLAVAILGRDILEDALADFKKKKMRKRKTSCPACAEKERIENEFLSFIGGSDGDDGLGAVITSSQGLCVPHYARLVRAVRHIPRWLSEFQEKRFTSLMKRTENFIEFSAWGRQKDFNGLSDADKVVWKELSAVLHPSP